MQPAQRQDGRFLNPDGSRAGPSFSQVWQLRRERRARPRAAWPEWIENRPYPAPQPPRGQAVSVTFLGHACFLLRYPDGTTLLTDPVFSERCSPVSWFGPKRVRAPGITPEKLPPIDAVLLSHAHYDHMDIPTLKHLHQRHKPLFVTGLGNAATLAKHGIDGAVELDWGQQAPLPGQLAARFLPARHVAMRTPFDRAKTLWGGFAITGAAETPGGAQARGTVIFLGDTAYGTHFHAIRKAVGEADLALIPIGAYDPRWFMKQVHMDPEEAVQAFQDLGARRAFGMHFGTFRLTSEPIEEPVQRMHAAMEAAGLAGFETLDCGQSTEVAVASPAF